MAEAANQPTGFTNSHELATGYVQYTAARVLSDCCIFCQAPGVFFQVCILFRLEKRSAVRWMNDTTLPSVQKKKQLCEVGFLQITNVPVYMKKINSSNCLGGSFPRVNKGAYW